MFNPPVLVVIVFMPQTLTFGAGLKIGRWKGRVLLLKKDFELARTDDGRLRSSSRIFDSDRCSCDSHPRCFTGSSLWSLLRPRRWLSRTEGFL